MNDFQTTVLIDKEKWEKLQKMGFQISSLTRAAMDQALDVSNEDLIFDMRIRRTEEEIQKLGAREQDLAMSLEGCRSRLNYLKAELEQLKVDSVRAVAVAKYSAVISRINRIIIHAGYDRNAIDMALSTEDGKKILEEMIGLNPTFDLTKQIQNIKAIMES